MNNVTHDATCGACYCPFFSLSQILNFIHSFLRIHFSTHNANERQREKQWIFWLFLFLFLFRQFSSFLLLLVVKFELKHIEKHMYAALCKQSPLIHPLLFYPKQLQFLMVFMVCLIVACFLFSSFEISSAVRSVRQFGVCIAFDLLYVYIGLCALEKKPYKRICVDAAY